MKRALIALLAVYVVGVLSSLGLDWYRHWSAGATGGFAFTEALAFASYWPLRAFWHLF